MRRTNQIVCQEGLKFQNIATEETKNQDSENSFRRNKNVTEMGSKRFRISMGFAL